MLFTHSLCSNFDIARLMRDQSSILPKYFHLVFTSICLYRPNNLWELYEQGQREPLYQWLRDRVNITRCSLGNLANSCIYRTRLFLLVDPILLEKIEFSSIFDNLFELSSDMVTITWLPISTRSAAEESLTNMYKFSVAPILAKIIYSYLCAFNLNILATRLDSDDGFTNSHYLPLVLSAESLLSNTNINTFLLDFPVGYQYDCSTNKLYRALWPEGNFSTLVYRAYAYNDLDNIISPFSYPHDVIPSSLPKFTITTSTCQWIQTIHSSNVANHIYPWSHLVGMYEIDNIFEL